MSRPFFAFSERKRAVRNKKYYPIDTGLRRMVVTEGGKDRGKNLEIAVYIELRRLGYEVFYWRRKGEVDFVVKDGGRIIPLQVSWEEPSERHRRAIGDFYENFPQSEEARFIGLDEFENGIDTLF